MGIKKEWLRKGAEAVSEIVDAVVAAKGSHPIVAGVSLGTRAIRSYIDFVDREPFLGWQLTPIPFSGQIRKIVAPDVTEFGEEKIAVAKLPSTRIGWKVEGSYVEGPFLEKPCPVTEISNRAWEAVGDKMVLHSSVNNNDTLASDVLVDTLGSKTAEDIAEAVAPYISAGYNRSLILHGPPGTGKSHIMRYVARLLGGRTLRINARALADVELLGEILTFLQPTAVIVDDIDRAPYPGALLGHIEVIVQSTGMFLCSANDMSKLPPAMVRVGRFSDIIEITHLDQAVIDRTTATFSPELRERTRGLPISVLEEIRIRVEIEGPGADVGALIERAKVGE